MKKLIKDLVDQSIKKNKPVIFQDFINNFYSQNSLNDFVDYEFDHLYDLAYSSYEFLKNKTNKNPKIQIQEFHLEKEVITIIDVINEDKAFLVDSVVALIESLGYDIINIIHPIYYTKRNKNGDLISISNKNDENDQADSVIQLQIKGEIDKNEKSIIKKQLESLLNTVSLVVKDWQKILEAVSEVKKEISETVKKEDEAKEINEFLSWLQDKGFIFLGFQEFSYKKTKSKYSLNPIDKTALGIFNAKYEEYKPRVANSDHDNIIDFIKKPFTLEILKSSYRSKIHRIVNAERIRIQKFDKNNNAIGEYRIIGLFTSAAYCQRSSSIPIIRNKINKVLNNSKYPKGSHNYKDLVSVLEDYPRDELFQIDDKDLARIANGIVMICGRNQVKLFSRKDKFSRFISCLVYMPKDRSNSEVRGKVRDYIAQRYNGEVADSFVRITESNLVRLQIIIEPKNKDVDLEEAKIEKEITELSKPWQDSLKEEIESQFSHKVAKPLYRKYRDSFSISYINRFDSRRAAIDAARIEESIKANSILFSLYKSSTTEKNIAELKIYSPKKELYLSEVMPVLESFGLNVIHEHIYEISPENEDKLWLHYFKINLGDIEYCEKLKYNFEEAVSLAWKGVLTSGSLNRLLIHVGLDWRQLSLVRAYTKYIYQAGFRHDQEYVSNILVRNKDLTKLLVEYFETSFDPELKISFEERKEKVAEISKKIKSRLLKVKDASHDEAIRKIYNAIDATMRTNFYQKDQNLEYKDYISFKFDCAKIPYLPLPVPYAEIFVFSNSVEGVHLRGGKVARGGLRWSDRNEDFRTEVLGLVKAQMTKNAVIVPVGSKGGFVVKKDLTDLSREEFMKEGIKAYKTFLRGLLDLTDNVINGKIKKPADLVIYDDDDPYLVVAADKGTATFSDIANSISEEYNFWLGDAFASGGSVGYDHKKMGITAKGAWVSVVRHFSEMGINIQKEEFSCIGIGDMSGDVFGNGMLLSKHTKLVAAFNHIHIFVDPNPDVKKSYKERQRLFKLDRSTWHDYDKSLISKGGAVFDRSAKSIKLTSQIKEVFDIEEDELSPTDFINRLLKAPVDLIWNGGIGTYVKSTSESHDEVGDRANDDLRVNGSDLRCKVIGEGGNLGLTQKGRIEYAINGGRINTDAMDNSAGVDCSDHEVNIKIALKQAMIDSKISLEQRNKILESMTDEVASLVLKDNRLQTQAITIAQSQGHSAIEVYGQFIKNLEKSGILNPEMEFLPNSKELQRRQVDKIGFTRPELCVMLSYAKMEIYQQILASDLVDDEYFESDLISYFPKRMQKDFLPEIKTHQLRREIIATQITNFIVDRGGITFLNQICQESGFTIDKAAKSFIIACDSFGLREIWQGIESQTHVTHIAKSKLFNAVNKLLERSVLWLLRKGNNKKLTPTIAGFKKIADDLYSCLPEVMAQDSKESYDKKAEIYRLNNVDEDLSKKIAALDPIASAFDIANISSTSKFDLKTIAKIYYEIGTRFSLKWLRSSISDLPCDGYWQRLSAKTIIEDFYSSQARLARIVVEKNCDKKSCNIKAVEEWVAESGFLVQRYDNFIANIKSTSSRDMSMFVVALNRIKPLMAM